jgi:hypothetical protein
MAAGELTIQAAFDHAERIRGAYVLYRGSDGAFHEVPFRRAATGPYVAVVPSTEIRPPALAYTIEIETVDGARIAAFASRAEPFQVAVLLDSDDLREAALLERLGGRRSVLTFSGEYVHFGSTVAEVEKTPAGSTVPVLVSSKVPDRYARFEAGYTYRLLGRITEFGIRGGVVRGRSVVPNEPDSSKYDVGLNYAAPTVRLRAVDWLHVDGEVLTSVTEVGFSVGGGGSVLIGDPYAAHLTLGFESIQVFGTRVFTRMDVVAAPGWIFAPMMEITDMPHAAKTGVRLLSEVRYESRTGVGVAVRGGYQARDAASGGPSGGLSLSYAF